MVEFVGLCFSAFAPNDYHRNGIRLHKIESRILGAGVRKSPVVESDNRPPRTVRRLESPFITNNDSPKIRLLKIANRLNTTHQALLIRLLWQVDKNRL